MDKSVKALIHEAEAQGFRVKPIKKGWLLYPPDKSHGPVTIHKTPSARNWRKAAVALLVARGFNPRR